MNRIWLRILRGATTSTFWMLILLTFSLNIEQQTKSNNYRTDFENNRLSNYQNYRTYRTYRTIKLSNRTIRALSNYRTQNFEHIELSTYLLYLQISNYRQNYLISKISPLISNIEYRHNLTWDISENIATWTNRTKLIELDFNIELKNDNLSSKVNIRLKDRQLISKWFSFAFKCNSTWLSSLIQPQTSQSFTLL